MKELGEYLRVTRLDNGVSLEEASEDLDLSMLQLENIEKGNVRAFKDVYGLKQYVRQYAKYLGLDPEKVIDEFNEFLFEHTSKISLDDILEAKKKSEEKEEKKIKSPYTKEYKKKINPLPIIILVVSIVAVCVLVYMIVTTIRKAPARTEELRGIIYEFTNETYCS